MYESAPWRTELRKFAVTLRDAPMWPSEEVPFELERAMFYSGVVLRKLIEDRKLTDSFATKKIKVATHSATAPEKSSVWRNMPGSVEFGFQNAISEDVPIRELCSQIVHFFGRYWWVNDDDDFSGMIVCSYRHQDKKGYLIEFGTWANLLDEASEAWPSTISFIKGTERSVE